MTPSFAKGKGRKIRQSESLENYEKIYEVNMICDNIIILFL